MVDAGTPGIDPTSRSRRAAARPSQFRLQRRISWLLLPVILITAGCGAAKHGGRWSALQAGVSYPLYRPSQTLGFRLSVIVKLPCSSSAANVVGYYGTYRGVLESATRGFGVTEGSPQICSNAADSVQLGRRTLQGQPAMLGVYCPVRRRCTAADGVTNGFTLVVTFRSAGHKATEVHLESSHLRLSEFIAVAEGLKLADAR